MLVILGGLLSAYVGHFGRVIACLFMLVILGGLLPVYIGHFRDDCFLFMLVIIVMIMLVVHNRFLIMLIPGRTAPCQHLVHTPASVLYT